MVENILRQIAGSSRDMVATQRQFRETAEVNNRSISKFAKDIASMFASQKRQSTESFNAINDSINQTQQSASKVDSTNSLLQESISLQSAMLSELKNVRLSIRSLADSIAQSGGLGGGGAGITPAGGAVGGMSSAAAKMLGIGGAAVAAGGAAYVASQALDSARGGGGGQTSPNITGKADEAKKAAEKYLGREMSPNEWSELIRATSAEAGRRDQTEVAMVMATILNRARDKSKSIEEILRERNQFQAVTGTRNNPNPSPNFVNMPDQKRLEQIYGASTSILDKVSRDQRNFTAASAAAYGPGTNIGFRDRMLASGGSKVGASIFNTAAPDLSGLTPSPSGDAGSSSGQTAGPNNQSTGESKNKQGHSGALERGVSSGLAQKLQEIESAFGGRLTVTSGARSQEGNKSVGGAGNSAHLRGNAVDVKFNGGVAETLKLIEAASKAGIGGIGVYGPGSVHLDVESKRAWGSDYRRGSVPQWAEGAIRAHETNKWGEYDASARGGGEDASRMGGGQMVGAGLGAMSRGGMGGGGMGGGMMMNPLAMMGGGIAGMVGAIAPAIGSLFGGGRAQAQEAPFDFKQFSMLPEDQQTSARFFEADQNERLRRAQNIQQRATESRAQEQTMQERLATAPTLPSRPSEEQTGGNYLNASMPDVSKSIAKDIDDWAKELYQRFGGWQAP